MPRNGSGVYSLPGGSTVTNGDTSDATDINTPLEDLVTDANAARPIVAGGTGATSASAARTALGLVIGTDVQAEGASLTSIAGLTTAADKMIYTTASDTYAVADLTVAGRALLDDADAAAQRTTLGLGTAATVDVIDEDSFATDSATRPPSQQSTKAYIDTAIPAKLNASGSAPVYAARAWVNFNGTGTVAIRASGNVSSITDNGTGNYTVNFTTAIEDVNYSAALQARYQTAAPAANACEVSTSTRATTSLQFSTGLSTTGANFDSSEVSVAIFR